MREGADGGIAKYASGCPQPAPQLTEDVGDRASHPGGEEARRSERPGETESNAPPTPSTVSPPQRTPCRIRSSAGARLRSSSIADEALPWWPVRCRWCRTSPKPPTKRSDRPSCSSSRRARTSVCRLGPGHRGTAGARRRPVGDAERVRSPRCRAGRRGRKRQNEINDLLAEQADNERTIARNRKDLGKAQGEAAEVAQAPTRLRSRRRSRRLLTRTSACRNSSCSSLPVSSRGRCRSRDYSNYLDQLVQNGIISPRQPLD